MGRVRGRRAALVTVVCCVAVALSAVVALGQTTKSARIASSPFVVANTSSVQKLDPDVVTNFLDFQALGLVYDTLVQFNSKLQITPDLATSWAFSDGNRVLTFQLRKGVKFDDGSTFNSADVVASLARVDNPKTADASASFIATVKKVVPVGAYSVKFELSHPGHLRPRRSHVGQPGDALDEGNRRRQALQRPRRHRSVQVRQLVAEQLVRRRREPQLLGRQGQAPPGRDQDDPD